MKKKVVSYLSTLHVHPSLWNSWHAKYITQIRLVLLLILSIVVVGLFAYYSLPRRLNPEIKIPIVIVSTVLPGAGPEDVESLLTIPLEDKIKQIQDIDTMTSTSQEGMSAISLQFKSTVDGDRARDDVQAAVDAVNDLPEDATTPSVRKLDFEDQPVWNFAVVTNSDLATLMRFSDRLKDAVEDVPTVDRVIITGFDEQTIEVIVQPEKIHEFNIQPPQLAQALQRAAVSYPAGNVETTASSFALTIDRDIATVDDIRSIRLSINNQSIRLEDIATVGFRSVQNQNSTYFASETQSPREAVQFFVYKASTANIDQAEHDARVVVEEMVKGYGQQFSLITIMNTAEEITKQFAELTRDFFLTILLVFTLLLIFLGIRQAVIASITVPLTFLSSFAIIYALGLSLNFLTMFAFLIALGLLIDDTIVTVAAMTRYYRTGRFTSAETGILVWRDFIVPLWSTTITTIWAFLPLLLATGIIGEFIKSIPLVVISTMLSSTSIAVLITLPLMIVFLKPVFPKRVQILFLFLGFLSLLAALVLFTPRNIVTPFIVLAFVLMLFITYSIRIQVYKRVLLFIDRHRFTRRIPTFVSRVSDEGIIDIEQISRRYMAIIDRILVSKHGKRNTLIAVIIFAVVAYALVPLGLVQNEFFPKQDTNLLYVTVDLPTGTNASVASKEAYVLADQIRYLSHVQYLVAETGQGFSGEMGRSNNASSLLVTVHLSEMEERDATSQDIAQEIREKYKDYGKGTLTVQELSGGPPAGADVQITLLGDDLTVLDMYATKTVQFLEKQPGVTNVDKSIKPGTSKLVFMPDKERVVEYGLSVDQVALWLRTYASGFTLDSIKFGEDEKDIVFRMSYDTQTPEDLSAIAIPSQTQKTAVPLLSLGKISLATNPTIITRESGNRTISVSASVIEGYNIPEINNTLLAFVQNDLELGTGYTWKTGGVNEENQKSVNSILQAMVLSFLLILITMVIEFRSFRQAFIALMIIPLSIAGVFYVFALSGTPLSFPALIGILALFGIVVTHAIVVIEKINDNLREKMPLRESIVDAAGSRLEPVLLTSLTTIVGLIPITISDPLWRGLGGAIIAGLIFSGAIKLFFVPVTFYLFFQDAKK